MSGIDISKLDRALAAASDPVQRLQAIAAAIPGPIAFSSSLGMEDQAILHAIASLPAETRHRFDVFTLDTGRHFPETLETIEASEQRYGLKIRVVVPESGDVEALVARDGINGFKASVDARKACCMVRKVLPLRRALAGASAWVTGIRREQSAGRGAIEFAALDTAGGHVKLSPLADWSLAQLEAYISANDIPVNALHARGFPSIGCQPCTRVIEPGEDIRAGRWWWENEDGKECGLHSPKRPKPAVQAISAGAPV